MQIVWCPTRVFFTNRVANNWNSLPSHVVHADTVNSLRVVSITSGRVKMYKLFDYHAEIHGTGSRSEASSKFLL